METPPTSRAPSHLPAIDALRGVLVLLVVLHHVHLRFVLNKVPVASLLPKPAARIIFWSGYYAVVMFFVVSGFLITHHSLRRWQALPRLELGAFYWLRFTRIYPCLLLLLAALTTFHLLGLSGYVIDPERSSLPRAILAALTFHFNWLEGTRGYLPGAWDVLWSLSVEEAFYLLFPLACLLMRREALIVGVWLALIAIGPVDRALNAGNSPWEEYAYLSCLDCIALGCLAAWLQHRAASVPRWLARASALTGGGLMVWVIAFRETVSDLGLADVGLHVTVLALGVAMTLWSIAASSSERLAAGSSWLRWVGRCSYEIYLTHMIVVLATVRLFQALDGVVSWVLVFYLGATLGSVAFGGLIARFVGQPLTAALRGRRTQWNGAALRPPA